MLRPKVASHLSLSEIRRVAASPALWQEDQHPAGDRDTHTPFKPCVVLTSHLPFFASSPVREEADFRESEYYYYSLS